MSESFTFSAEKHYKPGSEVDRALQGARIQYGHVVGGKLTNLFICSECSIAQPRETLVIWADKHTAPLQVVCFFCMEHNHYDDWANEVANIAKRKLLQRPK